MEYYINIDRYDRLKSALSAASDENTDAYFKYALRTSKEGALPLNFRVGVIEYPDFSDPVWYISTTTYWNLRPAPDGMVQYFCNDKAKAFVMKPGKFARKFFCAPDGKGPISDADVQKFAAECKSQAGRYQFKSTSRYLDMREAYLYGPHSCMSKHSISHHVKHPHYQNKCHPVLAYCTGDFELKYIVDAEQKDDSYRHLDTGGCKVISRCLVSTLDREDGKGRVRGIAYGDVELMSYYLEKEGYIHGYFNDHRVKRLELDGVEGVFLMPYIDKADVVYSVEGEPNHLILGPLNKYGPAERVYSCRLITGNTCDEDEDDDYDAQGRCECCEDPYYFEDLNNVNLIDGYDNRHSDDILVCSHCENNYYTIANEFTSGFRNPRFLDEDPYITFLNRGAYSVNSELVEKCFVSGEYFIEDDVKAYPNGIYIMHGDGKFRLVKDHEGELIVIALSYSYVSELEGKYYLTDTMAATDEFERLEELSTTTEEV